MMEGPPARWLEICAHSDLADSGQPFSEGVDFERAVRASLEHDAEVTLWNEGVFALGQTLVESLTKALSLFDFAVVVLTPDDLVQSRSTEVFGPRDNVIFELGLLWANSAEIERSSCIRPIRI